MEGWQTKYLILLVAVVLLVVGCQPAPPQATAPVEQAKPEVAILGTYKGEYSDKQKARWKEQNLKTAEVSIILQADGKFRVDSKFITDTAQSVFSASGKFSLEGDKLTLIADKLLEDGEERPVDPTPVVFTVTESGKKLISPPEQVSRDLSFPDQFVKE